MARLKNLFKRTHKRVTNDQAKGAQKTMLEELFNDFYLRRRDVYKMNFVRGVFFGFGTAIGGTVVVGLIIWFLALFVDFPFIGDFFQQAQDGFTTQ